MLMSYGDHDYPLCPDDVKHLVWEAVEYKASHQLNINLPGKRSFSNQPCSGFRLALKRLTQSLLLTIVEALGFYQFVACNCKENQLHYKSLKTSSIETVFNRPSS